MDNLSNENTCRICLIKNNTVYSLFRKRSGLSPSEKLNKIGLKVEANDAGPLCICFSCLEELDTTIRFLEKCERSNSLLAEQHPRVSDISHDVPTKDDLKIDIEPLYDVNPPVSNPDVDSDSDIKHNSKSEVYFEEPQCPECGSKRRCKHWTPPATHTCPYCQKVFSRKFNLKLHMRAAVRVQSLRQRIHQQGHAQEPQENTYRRAPLHLSSMRQAVSYEQADRAHAHAHAHATHTRACASGARACTDARVHAVLRQVPAQAVAEQTRQEATCTAASV